MKIMHYTKTALVSLALMLFATQAMALDLQEARVKGFVGEGNKGYVEALQPSPEVNSLVAEVNERRKEAYQNISNENKQAVDVVAKLAVGQIVEKLPSGSMYQDADGNWQKK